MGIVDARAATTELHCQTAGRLQMVGPVDCVNPLVKRLGIYRGETADHQQHAVGQARPQAEPVSHLQRTEAANRGCLLATLLQSKRSGFLEQQAFEPLGQVRISSWRSVMEFPQKMLRTVATLSSEQAQQRKLESGYGHHGCNHAEAAQQRALRIPCPPGLWVEP